MNSPEDRNSFEQGPIRPPSEARSLLIRVTRNCPWNRCAFCHTYRGETFSLRPMADIKSDILRMAETAEEIRALSTRCGEEGRVGEKTIRRVFGGEGNGKGRFQSMAVWLYYGGESVFLQDANSLIMKTENLAEALSFIRGTFPSITRITTYARAKTAARKTVGELNRLREAGLSRIHVGMESGYDPLLKFIHKGVTAAEQIEAGQKIREAGLSLCEYVMPGLGGRRWTREHAVETARVLNRINPDHIRLRTLQAVPGTPLAEKIRQGEFQPLDDEEILHEIRLFIETLEGVVTEIASDHILNLLEELEGKLPEDRARMLGIIDSFFALSAEERMVFRLGRRMGFYRRLDDLADGRMQIRLRAILNEYRTRDAQALERDIAEIRNRHI
ncbi:MAG: radical SAM protein [Proteobacteria bacterium]|nr:radical SAM protein [Pseudomonadota bacterium]